MPLRVEGGPSHPLPFAAWGSDDRARQHRHRVPAGECTAGGSHRPSRAWDTAERVRFPAAAAGNRTTTQSLDASSIMSWTNESPLESRTPCCPPAWKRPSMTSAPVKWDSQALVRSPCGVVATTRTSARSPCRHCSTRQLPASSAGVVQRVVKPSPTSAGTLMTTTLSSAGSTRVVAGGMDGGCDEACAPSSYGSSNLLRRITSTVLSCSSMLMPGARTSRSARALAADVPIQTGMLSR